MVGLRASWAESAKHDRVAVRLGRARPPACRYCRRRRRCFRRRSRWPRPLLICSASRRAATSVPPPGDIRHDEADRPVGILCCPRWWRGGAQQPRRATAIAIDPARHASLPTMPMRQSAAGRRRSRPMPGPSGALPWRPCGSASAAFAPRSTTKRGTFCGASRSRHHWAMSAASISAPGRVTTTAMISSSPSSDGTAIAATSNTPGCSPITRSSSAPAMFSPRRRMMSFLRET